MNYAEGVAHMREVVSNATNRERYGNYFNVNTDLIIQYPGRLGDGDYRLVYNNSHIPPTHADIVQQIFDMTNNGNYLRMIQDLEQIYLYGLHASTNIISNDIKELIYWITLQEDINYPPPRRQGRKLPFQRYFEAALAKRYPEIIEIQNVINRTNNHGGSIPSLLNQDDIYFPIFYNLN